MDVGDIDKVELLDILSQGSVVLEIGSDFQEGFSGSLVFFLEIEIVLVGLW